MTNLYAYKNAISKVINKHIEKNKEYVLEVQKNLFQGYLCIHKNPNDDEAKNTYNYYKNNLENFYYFSSKQLIDSFVSSKNNLSESKELCDYFIKEYKSYFFEICKYELNNINKEKIDLSFLYNEEKNIIINNLNLETYFNSYLNKNNVEINTPPNNNQNELEQLKGIITALKQENNELKKLLKNDNISIKSDFNNVNDYQKEYEKLQLSIKLEKDIDDINYAINSHVKEKIDSSFSTVVVDEDFFNKYLDLLNKYKDTNPIMSNHIEINLIDDNPDNPRVIFGNTDRYYYEFTSKERAKLACFFTESFIGIETFNDIIKKINILEENTVKQINKELEAEYKLHNVNNSFKMNKIINTEYNSKILQEMPNNTNDKNQNVINIFKLEMKSIANDMKKHKLEFSGLELFKKVIKNFNEDEKKVVLDYLSPLGCNDERTSEIILKKILDEKPKKIIIHKKHNEREK